MNEVSLIGRFVKDPELRYSESGTGICNFTLAVRNPFNKDGNADFPQCVAWGSGAELIAEKHVKGNMIGVSGRIATRSYENSEGATVYVTEVNVDQITLIQTKDQAEHQSNANGYGSNNGGSNNGNGNRSSGSGNRNNGNGNNRNGNGNGNNRNGSNNRAK